MLVTSGRGAAQRMDHVRWQWRSGHRWNDYAPEVCNKLEHRHQMGFEEPFKMWDGGLLHDIDLKNMRQMPGRRKIRRIPPEAAKANAETPSAGQTRSGSLPRAVAQGRWRRRAPHSSPPVRQARGKATPPEEQGCSTTELDECPRDLREFVHPGLANMQELRFEFSPVPPQGNRHNFPEGALGDMTSLADEYAQLLTKNWLLMGKMPILPLRGTPANVMAALSLAFFTVEFSEVLPLNAKCRRETIASCKRPLDLGEISPVLSIPSGRSLYSNVGSGMVQSCSAPQLSMERRPASAPAAAGRSNGSPNSAPFSHMASRPIQRISLCLGPDDYDSRSKAYRMRHVWREWQSLSASMAARSLEDCVKPLPALPNESGQGDSYEWIGLSNYPLSSYDRLCCSFQTLWHALTLQSSSEISSKTALLRASERMKVRPATAASHRPRLSKSAQLPAFNDAVLLASKGRRAAVLMIGSQFRMGGSFLTGLVHGIEEDILSRSNLFFSLREAARESRRLNLTNPTGYEVCIPEDGCIMSKDVVVFRNSRATGYAPRESGVQLSAVFSMSWPCSMPGVPTMKEQVLAGTLQKKLKTVLEGCHDIKADVLVISDEDEAIFKGNEGATLSFARALCAACKRASNSPPELMLGGSKLFKTTVNNIMGSLGSQ